MLIKQTKIKKRRTNTFINIIKENYVFLLLLIGLTIIISIQGCAPDLGKISLGNCCKIKDGDNQVKACIAGSLTQAECAELADSQGNLYSFAPQSSCINFERNPDCGVDANNNKIGCYLDDGSGVKRFYPQANPPENPQLTSKFCEYISTRLYKCDQGQAVLVEDCASTGKVCSNNMCITAPADIVGIVDINKTFENRINTNGQPLQQLPMVFIYTFYDSGLYSITRGPSLKFHYQNGCMGVYGCLNLSNEGLRGRYITPSKTIKAISNINNQIYTFYSDGNITISSIADVTDFIPILDRVTSTQTVPNAINIVAAVGSNVFYSDGIYLDILTNTQGSYTLPPGKVYNDIKEITKFEDKYYTFYSDNTFSVSTSFTNLANIDLGDKYSTLTQDCTGLGFPSNVLCNCAKECGSYNCAPIIYPTRYNSVLKYGERLEGRCCPAGQIYVNDENWVGSCQFPSCQDKIKNNGEEGVDCGGPCPARCLDCFTDNACGGEASAYLYSIFSSEVRSKAYEAIGEYASFHNVPLQMMDSSDEYMEAVAWYVDQHMIWSADPFEGFYLPFNNEVPADIQIAYGIYDGCGNTYCGDCEDHSILRAALLRTLGINWRCLWSADHIETTWITPTAKKTEGHTYNIVYYKGKYRIMDYGPLGKHFIKRWDQHRTDNIWNDRYGRLWVEDFPIGEIVKYTKNYENTNLCPSTTTYPEDTLYADVCP